MSTPMPGILDNAMHIREATTHYAYWMTVATNWIGWDIQNRNAFARPGCLSDMDLERAERELRVSIAAMSKTADTFAELRQQLLANAPINIVHLTAAE